MLFYIKIHWRNAESFRNLTITAYSCNCIVRHELLSAHTRKYSLQHRQSGIKSATHYWINNQNEYFGSKRVCTMDNDKCSNTSCCYSEYCCKSASCVTVTPDARKMIGNRMARLMKVQSWAQFSASSLLESSGQVLMDAVHKEQTLKGLNTCFKPPY